MLKARVFRPFKRPEVISYRPEWYIVVEIFFSAEISEGNEGDEVCSTFWSDNFFSLLHREEKVITAYFAKQNPDGEIPVLV